MTFAEMGAQLDLELNESSGLWFNDNEKSAWLNKSVDKYVKINHDQFEVSEQARNAVKTIVVYSAPQAGSIFDLSVVTDLFYPVRLNGNFDLTACGGSNNVVRRIKPYQLDDMTEFDPFEKGVNTDPKYEEVDNKFYVKSDTPPTSVTLTYLKKPNTVDIAGNPSGSLNLPDYTHYEIVDLAKDLCLENQGNPRYQTAKGETRENVT